jgi:hypothetical protein
MPASVVVLTNRRILPYQAVEQCEMNKNLPFCRFRNAVLCFMSLIRLIDWLGGSGEKCKD